jgi:pimeloyl-ACP methyl ester carboxylesterase
MWGAGGAFSLSSAIEDTAEAVRFLRDTATATKYRIEPRRVVLIGHSFGGFLAGYEGSRNLDLAGIAMLSAVNLGTLNADPKKRAIRLNVVGTVRRGLAARDRLERWARALRWPSGTDRDSRRSEPRGHGHPSGGAAEERRIASSYARDQPRGERGRPAQRRAHAAAQRFFRNSSNESLGL